MFAAIKLEHCADDVAWQHRRNGINRDFSRWLRDWRKLGPDKRFTTVSRLDAGGQLVALRGVPDYTSANHNGSRGVYYWYTLPPGVYQVVHRYKLNAVREYWLINKGGALQEVNQQEAMAWALQQKQNDT